MTVKPPGVTRRTLLTGGAKAAGLAATAAALAACGTRIADAGSDPNGPIEGHLNMLTPLFPGADGKVLLEKQLLPRFTARYPAVTVSVDYTTYDYLNEKITTGLTTGIPADVVMLGVGWVEPFASREVMSELKPPPGGLSGYSESVLASCRWGGKLYALPSVLDTRFGIARMDLLAEAGLTRPPTTIDELRDYAIRLTKRENGTLVRTGLDIQSLDPRQMYETMLFAFGGELFRDGKPAFNEPEGAAALQWLADLGTKDKVIDPGFSNSKSTSQPISDGRAAMCIGHNNWWVSATKQHPENLRYLRPFLLNPASPSIFAGGTLSAVSAASRHQSAAQALAAFMASPDVSLAGAAQRGNVPALSSLADTPYARSNALVRFALENLRYGRPEGGIPAWLSIRDDFKDVVQSALLGQQSAQKALDGLAATADAAIADFGT
jgi:multiple sugar transport system substrate-binding protein